YLRVRVDGKMEELKAGMQLDRFKIHDIELVIDRIQVEQDMDGRLRQSIHKGLEIGKGLLYLQDYETGETEQLSLHLMDLESGLSYEDPSPNTFSFNSPYGACPQCKGLGVEYQLNMDAVLPDKTLSVQAGGIAPLGEAREAGIWKQASAFARKHKIPLNRSLSTLTPLQLNLLLYANEEGEVTYKEEAGEAYRYLGPGEDFEGVINLLLRWFSDSDSNYIRNW